MKKKYFSVLLVFLLVCSLLGSLTGCGENKETVIIYTSAEDYRVEYMTKALADKFPQYDIIIEYLPTGNHAAKLMSEGSATECDIVQGLEYPYLAQLDSEGYLADLSHFDTSIYMADTLQSSTYLIEQRSSGAIILNMDVMQRKNLPEPTCYADLLNPIYKNLISMPSPKASGTGFMFLKSLVNAWGEEEALAYFDALANNILQFTSSGSGPVNALIQEEVAIGLGMTAQAVTEINKGANLKIVFFEEGAPFSLCGQAMVKGKETRPAVQEVFAFLINEFTYKNNELFFPEKIFLDKDYTIANYPANISYADMTGNTMEAKQTLLDKWVH